MKRRQVLWGAIAAMAAGMAKARPGLASDPLSWAEWNALSRTIIVQHRLDPAYASYLLFAVAVSQAIAQAIQPVASRGDPTTTAPGLASLLALSNLIPDDARLAALTASERKELLAPENEPLLRAISQFFQKRLDDGSDHTTMTGAIPTGRDVWHSLDRSPPLRPTWGNVKYFGIPVDPVAICPKPASVGSPNFFQELDRVKAIAQNASSQQVASVNYWADGIGTVTPPGHWHQLIEQLLSNRTLPDRIFGLLLAQTAMFNAGIACWCVKYHYWYPRPSQMDPTLVPHVSVPNFPSFPSGHSCFSWAAVQSLAIAFPDLSERLAPLAEEASQSRVLGGIHYPMDCSAGKVLGSYIGELTAKQLVNLQKVLDWTS